MPSFKAERPEAVEYDFTDYVDGARGIIPEPTEGKIKAYMNGVLKYTGETRESLGEDSDERGVSTLEMLEQMAAHRPEANEAIAELCSNQPSAEEVAQLPWRVFVQFMNYLQENLINPEAQSGDSTPPTPETTSQPTSTSERNSDSPSERSITSPEPSISSSVVG